MDNIKRDFEDSEEDKGTLFYVLYPFIVLDKCIFLKKLLFSGIFFWNFLYILYVFVSSCGLTAFYAFEKHIQVSFDQNKGLFEFMKAINNGLFRWKKQSQDRIFLVGFF